MLLTMMTTAAVMVMVTPVPGRTLGGELSCSGMGMYLGDGH